MKFAIFGNTYQAKKSSHAENLFRLLAGRKAQLCVCREFYNFLTSDLHLDIPAADLFDGQRFLRRYGHQHRRRRHIPESCQPRGQKEHSHLGHQHRTSRFSGRHIARRNGRND